MSLSGTFMLEGLRGMVSLCSPTRALAASCWIDNHIGLTGCCASADRSSPPSP